MNLKKLIDRVGNYEKTFTKKLDFENGKKLQSLLVKVKADVEVVSKAVAKNEEHKEQVEKNLASYLKRHTQLTEEEYGLAKQVKEGAGFEEQRKLHQVQFQLRALEREKRDYDATLETIRYWLLSLDEAAAVLAMMVDSLQRNLDRLGVVVDVEVIKSSPASVIKGASDYKDYLYNCPACNVRWEKPSLPACPRCGCSIKYFSWRHIATAYRGKRPWWKQVQAYIQGEYIEETGDLPSRHLTELKRRLDVLEREVDLLELRPLICESDHIAFDSWLSERSEEG